MTTYSPAMAAGQWNAQNAAFHLLARRGCPTLRVRYEDFIAGPEAAIGRIADFAGLPAPGRLPVPRRRRHVALGPPGRAHSVSGNPMRFTTGQDPDKPGRAVAYRHAEGAAAGRNCPHLPVAGPIRLPGSASHDRWPSVGVVLPTHNRPGLLRTALAAVLAQDYPGRAPRRRRIRPGRARPDPGRRRPRGVVANARTPGLAGARNTGITRLIPT